MENYKTNLNNFHVVYSEMLDHMEKTFSSSSSTSSNNSFIDITKYASHNIVPHLPDTNIQSTSLCAPKSTTINDKHKEELYKKKEEKMILKYQMEEAAKYQAIAKSKCGRFIKYDCKIGEGGYKIVSKGFDKDVCRDIAWCEVKRQHVDSKEKNQAMLKEINIMLKLDHPNVVKCYAVLKEWWLIRADTDNTQCEGKGLVIIQELMGAGTLKEMIKKNFHDGHCILDVRLITRWLLQILDALRFMHSRIDPPIIHRDVKSDNCFLVEQHDEDFVSVKIGDFGLATTINRNSQRNSMIGTLGFMAPEVYEEKYDVKVDMYAFGIMVLEVMTNKTPYEDCTNVFQVISKSMGSYLPQVISNIDDSLIKEMILTCVHPIPIYRPSAEELCEFIIFQNTPCIVEPFTVIGDRWDTITAAVSQLNANPKSRIINLIIRVNKEFIQNQNLKIDFRSVTLSLDFYQAHKRDLCEILTALNSHVESELNNSSKKLTQLKRICDTIYLQIRYLIKLINGERWRRVFEYFLQEEGEEKRNQRSNSSPSQGNISSDVKQIISTNSLNLERNNIYINNFAEYSHKVSVYHKATQFLDFEIEDYCREAQEKKIPYFFNWYIQNKTQGKMKENDLEQDSNKIIKNDFILEPSIMSDNLLMSNKPTNFQFNTGKLTTYNDATMPKVVKTLPISDKFLMSPTIRKNNEIIQKMVKAELLSSADYSGDVDVYMSNQKTHCSYQNSAISNHSYDVNMNLLLEKSNNLKHLYKNNSTQMPQIDEKINLLQHQYNYEVNSPIYYDYYTYRHLSEPTNSNAYNNSLYQVNQIYPFESHHSTGSNADLSGDTYHSKYSPQLPFNQNPITNTKLKQNYNIQTSVQPCNNFGLQQQSSSLINLAPSRFVAAQSNLALSSENQFSKHNLTGIFTGLHYNQTQFINPGLQFMQTNTTYAGPSNKIIKNQNFMSQPMLTRSLPSIVGSVPTSVDTVVVSDIYQSYLSSTVNEISSQSISPLTVFEGELDNNFQRIGIISNPLFSPKFSPPVISMAKPISVRPQPNYSTLISNTKILDKTKKKLKSRYKSKYLLKVINVQESNNRGETIITFEIMLPMHQMRFTCCPSNEINTLDVSNFIGETGQIPGELRKKDILESLINTVKKICKLLTDNINSISLNEDYVFHPCLPNSGLVKLSDYVFPIALSSLSSSMSLQPIINFNNINTSSRSLSPQPSNENVSSSLGNLPTKMSDQLPYQLTESDLILFSENDVLKPIKSCMDNQQKIIKYTSESDPNDQAIVLTKCNCFASDSTFKVPDYIFSTVKQIIDKLLNLHCKGVIILPQSNDILTRNFRVLEIPAEHMFVGIPSSDTSYNVIKGQKDKDFIIAKDTRDPQNDTEKCVYQKPSDGAVLLDSTGEIHYIQQPSLIIPSKPNHGYEKTEIKELPSILTNHKDKYIGCDQIISILESLNQFQNISGVQKDEVFDIPVMLEHVKNVYHKSQTNVFDKAGYGDSEPRRGSDESILSQVQPQSQIQVERLFCQYVSLPKTSDIHNEEIIHIVDNNERDLPKQQVRSRKISNESLDSISMVRARSTSTVTYLNELEPEQSQSSLQKIITSSQMNLQNVQKSLPQGTIINQIPLQRITNVSCSVPSQFILTNQNPSNSMPGNIFIQSVQSVPLYSNSQSTAVPVVVSQNNPNISVLSNKSAMGHNFSHILPNQKILPTSMTQNQLTQLHQMQQTAVQRLNVPSPMSSFNLTSSQLLSNIQALQHNTIPVPQQVMTTQIYPTQISSFSDQYGIKGAHLGDVNEQSFSGLTRPMPITNVRQLQAGSSQYYDQNMITSIMAENLKIQMKNQPTNTQPSTGSVVLVPHQALLAPTIQTTSISSLTSSSSMIYPSPENPSLDRQILSVPLLNGDSQPKVEQAIGRFIIRPVTDNSENS